MQRGRRARVRSQQRFGVGGARSVSASESDSRRGAARKTSAASRGRDRAAARPARAGKRAVTTPTSISPCARAAGSRGSAPAKERGSRSTRRTWNRRSRAPTRAACKKRWRAQRDDVRASDTGRAMASVHDAAAAGSGVSSKQHSKRKGSRLRTIRGSRASRRTTATTSVRPPSPPAYGTRSMGRRTCAIRQRWRIPDGRRRSGNALEVGRRADGCARQSGAAEHERIEDVERRRERRAERRAQRG